MFGFTVPDSLESEIHGRGRSAGLERNKRHAMEKAKNMSSADHFRAGDRLEYPQRQCHDLERASLAAEGVLAFLARLPCVARRLVEIGMGIG